MNLFNTIFKNREEFHMLKRRNKTISCVLFIMLLSSVLLGCGNSNFSTSTTQLKPDVTKIATVDPPPAYHPGLQHPESVASPEVAVTDFAVRLFQKSLQEEKNTLISPLSVLYALSMTAYGADSDTLVQMENTFGMPLTDLSVHLDTYLDALSEEDTCKLHIADSIWFKDSDEFTINHGFLQNCQSAYDAQIYTAPFDSTTLNDINNWVNNETDGMISNILNNISDDAVMYLINALAFDAEWESNYYDYEVHDGTFITEKGETQDAKMMYHEEHQFLSDDNAQGFLKYYAGRKYAFAALLPNEDVNINDFIASLNGEKLHIILSNPHDVAVNTGIPKFQNEYALEMSSVLQEMGMTNAFDENKAAFPYLGHSKNGSLYISNVLHKTFIAVDEKGTKAGAATVVAMLEGCAIETQESKDVILDRPFVYMIIDCEQNVPIFIGTVMEIE